MDPRQNGYSQQRRQPQSSERQHQRFSWQTPPETPPEQDAQAYQQPHQQPQQQQSHPYAQQQQQQVTHVNTNVNPQHNRAFSYAQTPIEHRAPYYTSSPNDPPLPQSPSTPIDPRPQSIYNPHNHPTQPQPQPTYSSQPWPGDEKPPLSPTSPQSAIHPPPFSPASPVAHPQQIHIPQNPAPQSNHARQRSNLSPINTNVGQYPLPPVPATPHSHKSQTSPLPQKAPITPISPGPTKKAPTDYPLPMSPTSKASYAHEPYSPHGLTSPTRTQHAVFSPDCAHGPNGLDFALHQPGQVSHPNMDLSDKAREWKHSLCGCSGDISTCLTGLFCPCILYGRTSYRLSQKSEKKDPTDMLGYKATNGHCMLMSISCGLWWLFPMVQRTRIRHAYKLAGSLGSDIVKGCCCCCCVAIQNEREVKDREENTRRWAGPATTEVYTSPGQMIYSPQG